MSLHAAAPLPSASFCILTRVQDAALALKTAHLAGILPVRVNIPNTQQVFAAYRLQVAVMRAMWRPVSSVTSTV